VPTFSSVKAHANINLLLPEVACTLERPPLLDKEHDKEILEFKDYPIQLDSPLVNSHVKFIDSINLLGISIDAARLLDDMRFLTITILSFRKASVSEHALAKFQATTKWIHERLTTPLDPSLANDFIYQACRSAAIIYSEAILSRAPLSKSCTSELLKQLWVAQWRVPLERWKKTPGIYFWILLTSAPFSKNKPEGKWQKSFIACVTTAMGLVDWKVTIGTLRTFVVVQRWLDGGETEKSLASITEEGEGERTESI